MPDPARSAAADQRPSVLWAGALVLAAAATAVLVLSDDSRVLKLGLVAALWAALLGAFGVAKLRGKAAEAAEREAERQRIYEIELEREIAARREFEATAEAEARRAAAAESDAEIQALKAELRALRKNLEQMLGGDVLFERVALRAESTRVRSLPERPATGEQPRIMDGETGAQPRIIQPDARGRQLPVAHRGQVAPAAPEAPRPAEQQPPNHDAEPRNPAPRSAEPRNPEPRNPESGNESGVGETRNPEPGNAAPRNPEPPPAKRRKPGRPRQSGPAPRQAAETRRPRPAGTQGAWPESTSDRLRPVRPEQAAAQPEQPAEQPAPEEPAERRSPTSEVPAGAHTEGTSVTDLLAAYGDSAEQPPTKRRRRRES
ncbi:DUF6779 domain-containing protein [Saccharopolyspora sp. MS10]|uniref:DUF6779 domain-containing protein n=1 Tax=Saccharopolyspora sp. MS10 TaxID=3385973 RepID=UPI0039A2DCD1